jgi:hypothetical protein
MAVLVDVFRVHVSAQGLLYIAGIDLGRGSIFIDSLGWGR